MPELNVDPRIEHASTLPATFYKDPAWFERSKDAIFAKSWQWVAHQDMAKVPGAVYPFTLLEGCLNEPLVLTRDANDQTHLLSNVCTHRGMQVCEGIGNERFLRCRYHGRRFGLDGGFQHMPEFEDVVGFPTEADNLPKIPHAWWGPFLFTSVDPAASFEDWMGPMLKRLDWLPLHEFRFSQEGTRDYLVKANWALYCDNYLEGFHIPFIHADLNAVIDYENYSYELFEHGNLQLAVSKGGDDVFDLPESSPDYGQAISAYYYWFFPNLMFNFYPWGLSINVVKPLANDVTRVSFIRYVWDESKLDRGAGGALDRVEREDEAVVELVQKGVQSRFYDRGRFAPKREIGTHHFHTLIGQFLK
ncbi:MAG: choline monooxygenase [Armatimonadetes bacterium 55-13]|nr:aromatic ring-hydroxylating dioxygenase subunit alpha [Armatimonadota bacterium]OJU64062.1 MAG: choline monooxygenase [Armatimonadetes bacterium 55-13]